MRRFHFASDQATSKIDHKSKLLMGAYMAKQSWNKFTTAHPNAPAFTAAVSSSLPKGIHFDNNGLKLPTPYGLLVQWLQDHLSHDWTSSTKRGVIIVKVGDRADAAVIVKQFPAIGAAKKHLPHQRLPRSTMPIATTLR